MTFSLWLFDNEPGIAAATGRQRALLVHGN